ncbi:MAG: DUF1836 domain-containing protein [Erysipelotrichaceae bacterium]|nr:DUF1836 domain-containing protein [Erysipelotrichaceae bacterium]
MTSISVHLPQWEELPDIDLYMDQVLSLIDRYLTPIGVKPVTAAMINNYVKLKLIPKPVAKRYSRMHVAYIFAIAILKDVFEISQIQAGVMTEIRLLGLKNAYNLFTSEIESAVSLVSKQCESTLPIALMEGTIDDNNIIMKLAALTFASKRLTTVYINKKVNEEEKEND